MMMMMTRKLLLLLIVVDEKEKPSFQIDDDDDDIVVSVVVVKSSSMREEEVVCSSQSQIKKDHDHAYSQDFVVWSHKKKGKIIPRPHYILFEPTETLAKNTKKIQKNVPARARYIIRILSAPRNSVVTIQRVSCHPGTPRMLEY